MDELTYLIVCPISACNKQYEHCMKTSRSMIMNEKMYYLDTATVYTYREKR